MWFYHFTIRNKALVYSIYLIFLFLGLLSWWRSGLPDSIGHDYLLFRPLLISFLLVLVLIKLMKSIYHTAFVAFHILSVNIITMVYIELSGLQLSLIELVGASIYLIAVSSVIALYIFEHHRGLVTAVGKAVLYSATFYILLLIISKLYRPLEALQSSVFVVVIVGQVIAYFVSLLLSPLLSHFISQKEMTMVRAKHKEDKIGNINFLLFCLFVLIIIVSMFYIVQRNIDYFLAMIWFFSLFLITGMYNSFRKALIIHILLLLFIPSLAICVLVSGYIEQGVFLSPFDLLKRELLLGLLISWGGGLLPILTWVYIRYLNKKLYSLSIVIYVVALFPLVLGLDEELGLKWVTFMMIVGYSIVNSVTPIYYLVMESMIYSEKKRADRPFKELEVHEDEIHSRLTSQTIVSVEERERDLNTVYGEWLQKREQRLEQNPQLE